MPDLINGGTIVTTPLAPSTHVVTPAQSTTILTSPGVQGPAGPGLDLEGAVATYGDLPTGLGMSDNGKAYVVNANGKVYVWDGTAFPLLANGVNFTGATGATGVGISGITLVGSDVLRFAKTDASNTDVTVPAITAAAASASAAAASATAAAGSATSASGSASAASGSATAASGSASAASTSAGAASTSASGASTSASAAATSASGASSSASAAAASAVLAAADAVDADSSATAAAVSASASATSATASATAKDLSVAAKNSAETAASTAVSAASDASDSADAAAASALEAADVVSSGIPSATNVVKGGVLLPGVIPGELGGTYDHPSVTGWADKADLVGGVIPSGQIPAIALVNVQTVANTAARVALTAQAGDVAVQTGNPGRGTYILKTAGDPTVDADWILSVSPTDAVTSVNGYTGIVVLAKADVGLGSVDNTTDAGKPVSTAQQTALDLKAPNSRTISAGTGLTGGGDLSANRSLAADFGTTAGKIAQGDDSRITGAVQTSRTLTAGTGLTGGGTLAADRTFAVAYGTAAGTATQGNDTRVVNAVQKDVNNNATVNNLQEGYTTTATASGTTTLTVASTQIQMFTGTLAQNVKLPDVTTLVLGMDFVICNNSTGILTVQSSGSNTILAIPAGARCTVTCVALTGTTAASWFASPVVTFGTTAGTVTQGNDSRLSDTRTPSANTVPCDFVYVCTSPGTARATGTGDWTVGMYVGRAFTLTSVTYQFETADASGTTSCEVRRNGSQVSSSNLTTLSVANQADGTSTDAARTATPNQSFAVGDRLLVQITAIGTTPGKGLKVYLKGTWN